MTSRTIRWDRKTAGACPGQPFEIVAELGDLDDSFVVWNLSNPVIVDGGTVPAARGSRTIRVR